MSAVAKFWFQAICPFFLLFHMFWTYFAQIMQAILHVRTCVLDGLALTQGNKYIFLTSSQLKFSVTAHRV